MVRHQICRYTFKNLIAASLYDAIICRHLVGHTCTHKAHSEAQATHKLQKNFYKISSIPPLHAVQLILLYLTTQKSTQYFMRAFLSFLL